MEGLCKRVYILEFGLPLWGNAKLRGGEEFCLVATKDPIKLGGKIGFITYSNSNGLALH